MHKARAEQEEEEKEEELVTEKHQAADSTATMAIHQGRLQQRPQLPFLAEIRALRTEQQQQQQRGGGRGQPARAQEESKAVTSPPTQPPPMQSRAQPAVPQQSGGNKTLVSRVLEKSASPASEEAAAGSLKSVQFRLPAAEDVVNGTTTMLPLAKSREASRASSTSSRGGKRSGSSGGPLRLTEKSNMAALADIILPQLNEMQKNYLGLLFFNELSQNIVDEIVAQQVSMMSGSKLAATLAVVSPQASDTAGRALMQQARAETRAAIVVDSLCAMDAEETAETLLNIAGHQSINIVTAMCEMAGPRFKHNLIQTLVHAEEEEEEEPDIVYDKMALPPHHHHHQLGSPPVSSSEEGYASANVSPSGENTNHEDYGEGQ